MLTVFAADLDAPQSGHEQAGKSKGRAAGGLEARLGTAAGQHGTGSSGGSGRASAKSNASSPPRAARALLTDPTPERPMEDDATPAPARALGASEGPAFWFLGTLVTLKATSAETGGAFTLLEQLAPPGFGPPLHVHHVEDEAFYVLEGHATFFCAGEELALGPGGYVFLPKGVAHRFEVSAAGPARLLQWTWPAGFDRFVEELGEPAPARALPPPAAPPIARLLALAPKYHFSVVGPPPGAG